MRPSTLTLGLLVTALSACGGGSLRPGGTAGASGGTVGTGEGATGGTVTVGAGGGGIGGSGAGGTGGEAPECAASASDVGVAIVGPDGKLVGAGAPDGGDGTSLRESITVTSVDSCAAVGCPSRFPEVPRYPGANGGRKIVLTGTAGQQWTLYLRNDHMPNDVIAVGDALDLIVDARMFLAGFWSLYQTVVLARGSELIAFARYTDAFSTPGWDLKAFRVGFGSEAECQAGACTPCRIPGNYPTIGYPVMVTAGSQRAVVARGETKTVGWLSFTNSRSEWVGGGDSSLSELMAGFRTAGNPVTGAAGMGGSGAVGGVGGTGGGGATGTAGSGAGGMLPACTSNGESVAVALTLWNGGNWDGMPVTSINASKAVTVASVESCTTASCEAYLSWLPAFAADFRGGLRIGLLDESGAKAYRLYIRNTPMPSDLIKVGDAFYLNVDVGNDLTTYRTNDQTIVLSRGDQPIVFAAGMSRFGAPPVPQLEAHGITVGDADAVCQGAPAICTDRPHSARVMIGAESAVVAPGQAATIGGFSFTNGSLLEVVGGSSCDRKSQTFIAGFRLP